MIKKDLNIFVILVFIKKQIIEYREVLSYNKSDQELWLTSTNFSSILVLMKFLSQLIIDFQNQHTKVYDQG